MNLNNLYISLLVVLFSTNINADGNHSHFNCYSTDPDVGDSALWAGEAIELFSQNKYAESIKVVDACFNVFATEAVIMQKELDAEGYDISILGINHMDKATGNESVTTDRDLPWLQDVAEVDMWSNWSVGYRDVFLVDATGMRVQVFNLSGFSLGEEANYTSLKDALISL